MIFMTLMPMFYIHIIIWRNIIIYLIDFIGNTYTVNHIHITSLTSGSLATSDSFTRDGLGNSNATVLMDVFWKICFPNDAFLQIQLSICETLCKFIRHLPTVHIQMKTYRETVINSREKKEKNRERQTSYTNILRRR